MKLAEIIRILEQLAPPVLQESYDNSGLQCGSPDMEIKGAVLSLDCTEDVIREAIKKRCNLIICHHPVIFKSLKRLTGNTEVERILALAIKKDICIYACHTNLDNVRHGVNGKIAEKLGLAKTRVLAPKSGDLRKLVTFCPTKQADQVRDAIFRAGAGQIGNYAECSFFLEGTGTFKADQAAKPFVGKKGERHHEKEQRIEVIFPVWLEDQVLNALLSSHPYEEVAYDVYPLSNAHKETGSGLVGELVRPVPEEKFLHWIRAVFGTGIIRHSPMTGKRIKTVAVCGGSGAFLISAAKRAKADIFITGDVKYHDFFLADGKMLIADVGHAESEQFTPELFYEAIRKKFPKFAVHFSNVQTNPVNYF